MFGRVFEGFYRQAVVILGTVDNVGHIGFFQFCQSHGIVFVAVLFEQLVVIPIARVYGDIACLIVMGLQPLAHTIALFSRVALFQKGKTVARCPACHDFQGCFGFAYAIKVLWQGHVRLV